MNAETKNSLLSRLNLHIDAVLARQVELLRELIGCRTVSTPVPQEAFREEALRAIAITAAALNEMDLGCEIWVTAAGFPVLRARKGSQESGPTIGFNGHLDVVPIEDPAKWRHDPWGGEIDGATLYGRGACDAKGPVVSMIGALKLLQAAGIEPATGLLLHIVTDEEVAGDCTDACLERGWPDTVIIGEPSSLDVWIAETDRQHPLVRALLDAAQRVSPVAKVTAAQGASLLPWYTRRGIPGVIFGAGNIAQAHGVDEFLDLENLRATTLALALALADDRLKEAPRIEQ